MAKPTLLYECSHCDAQYPKWVGRCEQCGKWSTVATTPISLSAPSATAGVLLAAAKKPTALSSITTTEAPARLAISIQEIDRVLGGGVVPGSLILLGGDPGVGKSTLSLHIASRIPGALYISGEESVEQIRLRATRLGITELLLLHETGCATILATIEQEKPPFVVIDSIQTVVSDLAEGAAGSVSQIRACTAQILEVAKRTNTAVWIVGHVTKDGSVAGPRTLEHLVDAVLYLEGDEAHEMRILRGVKNRFGTTDEVGIFAMHETGLEPARNPATAFLTSDRADVPGNVVTVLMDGKQPLLVEVQALTTRTTFGYPQRRSSGFDLNRLQVLIAVLTQRANLPLSQYDVHVNIVGGVKVTEPAADLAIAAAIASSLKNIAFPRTMVAFGEVGLGGEVRPVKALEKRVQEAKQFGFETVLAPPKVKTVRDLLQQLS